MNKNYITEWVDRLYDVRSEPDKLLIMVTNKHSELHRYLTTPQPEASDREELLTIKQRDQAEECIDKLLDLIGVEHEWSSSFGFSDAIESADEKLSTLRADERRKTADLAIRAYLGRETDNEPEVCTAIRSAILGETTP